MKAKNMTAAVAVAVLLMAVGSVQAAMITWTGVAFSDVNQLSTSGTLVEATHFPYDDNTTVTANGIQFVGRHNATTVLDVCVGNHWGSESPVAPLSIGPINGLTTAQAYTLLNGVAGGPGTPNGTCLLSGLTNGVTYQLQLIQVGYPIYFAQHVSSGNLNSVWDAQTFDFRPFLSPYGYMTSQIITGTFTADATTQYFHVSDGWNGTFPDGGDNSARNMAINAFQLRQAIPEPGSLSLLGLFGGAFLLRRKMRK